LSQEAILKFILEKKKEYEKKLAEYERQKEGELEEFREVAAAEKEEQRRKFEQTERSIVTKRAEPVRYGTYLPNFIGTYLSSYILTFLPITSSIRELGSSVRDPRLIFRIWI